MLFYHQRRLREIYYDPVARLKYLSNSQSNVASQAANIMPVANQASGDKKLEDRFHMAATYMRVLQSSNRVQEQQAAVAQYDSLKTAFNTRDAIIGQAANVSHAQVIADGADKHIIDAILSGHITSLNMPSQNIVTHQPAEQAHELQS